MKKINEKFETSSPEKKSRNNNYRLAIVILAFVIAIQGVKLVYDDIEAGKRREVIAQSNKDLEMTRQKLSDISAQLDSSIADISRLGGSIEELTAAKQEINDELKNLKHKGIEGMIALKEKLEGYERLLLYKDEEIERLKSSNSELFTKNKDLKNERIRLNDSISVLAKHTNQLVSKVVMASQLKAENIKVTAVNVRGKERRDPFKNRHIKVLKVTFNIAENPLAPIEKKRIYMQIVGEHDKVIFDVDKQAGTFMVDGKEHFYTADQEIFFDNSSQQITFAYEKGGKYDIGLYKVGFFTDGYEMGTQKFTVKK